MRRATLHWHAYRYLPYERDLARREVQAMFAADPHLIRDGLEVDLNGHDVAILQRLTYFREAVVGGKRITPMQASLEASALGASRMSSLSGMPPVSLKRQSTRYSAHGLHEYKGKFNPQIVRALGNIMGLSQESWVLDPFCGSGTTLLECAHSGWNALGLDLNPLGVLITNAKIQAIRTPAEVLRRSTAEVLEALRVRSKGLTYGAGWTKRAMSTFAGTDWSTRFPDFEYLAAWFPWPVLAQSAVILQEIDHRGKAISQILQIVLSDLLREASLQDPGDLRIRRRKDPKSNYPLIPSFLEAAEARIGRILNAQEAVSLPVGKQIAAITDSRDDIQTLAQRVLEGTPAGFDGVITSPPYATALPYIDTQRLSLCLLGLISASELRSLERELVGSREIGERERQQLVEESTSGGLVLPESILGLLKRMLALADRPENGFRRRNMPALVYKYFADMARALESIHKVARPQSLFALVVGANRTVLSGKTIVIDTPRLVADLAEKHGWRLQERVKLDTYQRFDVHQKNSIRTESLVLLERS